MYSYEKPYDQIVELHNVEARIEPDESIIEADLITHAGDSCNEEIPEEGESLIDEMLDSDRR